MTKRNPRIFAGTPINFFKPNKIFQNSKLFFKNYFQDRNARRFFSRKKGQSGVDKTRLKRLKRTPLQRWRYKLDKKRYEWPTYAWPAYEVSREQEVKIGYFKLQMESLVRYFHPFRRK